MLEVRNLVKTYKSKSGVTVKALDNVSLKFPKTGMIFILGKSGSGKSTLLNVLGGLDSFDSGDIIVKGKSTHYFKQSHFDSFRNTYVGFIFQEYNILDNFTVGQNIALAMQLQSRKPTSENINAILNAVDLKGLGDRKPNELSGGQKQRVAIARALIKNPDIIMADEPTGALDSNTGIQIFDTLKKLSKIKLVIIISHDREFSERYADRIIELKDGQVISDVSVATSSKEKEEGLMFADNEVIVKSDYELTAKDLKVINAYIKKHRGDVSIKGSSASASKAKRGHFVETKQDKIVTDTSGFRLIKSRLPMKRAFQMGASGLKHKKLKLGMTIVLSLVAFTMLGATATIALTDQNAAMANALSSSNYSQASIEKYKYHVSNFAGQRQTSRNYSCSELSASDISNIKNIIGTDSIEQHSFGVIYEGASSVSYSTIQIGELQTTHGGSNQGAFLNSFKRFADGSRSEITKAGYTIYTEEKPTIESKANAVYISRYMFDSLCKSGTVELEKSDESGEKQLLTKGMNANKAVGCIFNLCPYSSGDIYSVIIGGVFDTGFDIYDQKYSKYITQEYLQTYNAEATLYEILNAREKDIDACCIGCNKGFVETTYKALYNQEGEGSSKPCNHVTTISKSFDFSKNSSTKSLINSLSKEFDATSNTFNKYCLNNTMLQQLESVLSSFAPLRVIFLYVGLAFIVFSGLLLANFIANSISYQKREIGILRAIGARGKDVFKIYISEAFIVAAINFVASIVTTWAVVKFAITPQLTKITAGVTIMKFGIIEILILLGVSFLSAFLATFIPVKKTADKKPVDAIRNK